MSERAAARALALAALLPLGMLAAPPESPASAILAKADRTRTAWEEAALTIRVTTTEPGKPPRTGTFEVEVKGRDRARVSFRDPGEEGKALVLRGNDAWLLLPTARNPIKVPRSYRVTGGFSVADVSRVRFEEDYDAVVERGDELSGMPCDVLRLTARPGRSATYPVARVWVDRKEGLYRKAVFLLASGKTAREVTFEAYRPFHGVLSLARMTVVDSLRSGKTEVEYLGYERRPLADSLFDPAAPRPLTGGHP